jgi:NADH-quinone oxidoreductase subunit N
VLVGLAFKATIVPFHQWTPDVYVGAPTPVTAFMAAATKAAAFGALLRVLWIGFPVLQSVWVPLVGALAVATMLVGNLAALVQGDIKRMLAFSAVAHAGYVLVAVAAGPPDGAMAAVFYLLVYALMNLGAFGVVIALGRADDGARDATRLEDFRGLSRRHPGLALALAIFLLSLTGLPPTAGFLGKWYIFRAAIGAGLTPLAVFLVLMSAVSAFYYFRPVLLMYMAEPEETGPIQVSAGEAVAVAVTALIVAGALVLAVPFAKSARVAGLMGAEDPQAAGVSGGPGQALYFAAPNFDKDRRVATPAGGTNE